LRGLLFPIKKRSILYSRQEKNDYEDQYKVFLDGERPDDEEAFHFK